MLFQPICMAMKQQLLSSLTDDLAVSPLHHFDSHISLIILGGIDLLQFLEDDL